jgi:hypothetical protein
MARSGQRDLSARSHRQDPPHRRRDRPGYKRVRHGAIPVRMWDPILRKQIGRLTAGLDAAEQVLADSNAAKHGRAAYKPRTSGSPTRRPATLSLTGTSAMGPRGSSPRSPRNRPASTSTCSPLGNAWIGDLDLPELNAVLRKLTLCDGTPASGGTKSAVAAVLRRMFAWAREQCIILVNPGLELRSGWGSSARRKVIPSIQQVLRLAAAIDHFKPCLGDVAIVLALTGLRSEEAVAVPIGNVNLAEQSIYIVRTASESGGRRDIRDDLKTRAAERTVMIPDIAMPAVRRLADHGAPAANAVTAPPPEQRPSLCQVGHRGDHLGFPVI